ncbi:thiamine phosphate synthase [Staphylococcus xylosus]|jgi:thiamine-phosphate pyrophosphorylase|uniref:Thiamine-phosphate synthase n=1 Tax=Staphylococcus xylosus TaxID=1288 RepID=A0A5R9AZD5_STAXY|nr:thiamine phosphate synthase [Staphylococcus xylosus]AID42257.1 Thiamin-phosphate pyrophosphorylase [Staphylococcus xylosus]MBE6180654.1 thiamine phosphate synthase [Staphylococcus xylosus]MEB6321752.1 thiamine phosphate synthase [Staphylococcus xylosus]MEB7757357.1 thiamine phosphate synthase [Staphylococcus xylosus]MEB8307846.1 thiamine phosphate synthase [Staphylococcus xylosus]
MFDKDSLKVYFICGTQDIPVSKSIKEVVKTALDSGITMFQYREKGDGSLTGNDKVEMAQQLLELCHAYNVPFIVNDDVTLAENINADGIHVGQNDMKVTEFAQKFKNKIIGLSISDIKEYEQSDLTYVDYIGVGPMYATNSKQDANSPVGPEMIPKLRSYIEDFPIVAIGGITVDNTEEIIQAGANGVSIISAISKSDNISKTVRQFLQNVD